MKSFEQLDASKLTRNELTQTISSAGYVLVRGLLPRDTVTAVLDDVTQILSISGWLQPEYDSRLRMADATAACGDPDPTFKHVYQQVFNLESFHALPHHPALRKAMQMIAGERVLVHPKPIGRLIFPNCEQLVVHAHQDYEFMKGDAECFTVWIPLHDCPVNVGPLRMLEGSHRFGVQSHARENLHVPEIPAGTELGDDWAGGDVMAGDVLIFHSLTVHAASPNVSDQLRLSIDCRFQDAHRALNPANLVFAGQSGKSWEKTYSAWRSDDLKFYWKSLPLNLSPSKTELKELARTSASAALRTKYERMIGQLD